MTRRLRIGVTMGMLMATAYSAYAIVLFMFRGDAPFNANGVSLRGVIAAYYASGFLGGAVVGLLSPLVRGQRSAVFVGIVAAFPVFVCLGMSMYGYFWQWGGEEWSGALVMTVIFGIFCGGTFWSPGALSVFDDPTKKSAGQ